jgi:formylmethanofuran:tetrahydromethanopterin formyltransferase
MANTKITDIMEWDEAGQIKVKASKDIPEHALQAIRSIKVNKDGNLELELYDKVGVLRLLAKASGLLDSPEDSDKPSVIGINIKPPDIEDVEIK